MVCFKYLTTSQDLGGGSISFITQRFWFKMEVEQNKVMLWRRETKTQRISAQVLQRLMQMYGHVGWLARTIFPQNWILGWTKKKMQLYY